MSLRDQYVPVGDRLAKQQALLGVRPPEEKATVPAAAGERGPELIMPRPKQSKTLPVAAPTSKKSTKTKPEKSVNVMTAPADITDVATVEQQIEQHALRIEEVQHKAVMEIGRELKAVQDIFRFKRDEGGFEGWLSNRLPHISRSAAYNAVQMFDGIGKYPELWTLSDAAKIQASTAEPDVKAIIAQRVEAGEVFTAARVKDIKDRAAKEAEEFKATLDAAEKASLETAEKAKSSAEKRIKELEAEVAKPIEHPAQPALEHPEIDRVLQAAAGAIAWRNSWNIQTRFA